MNINVLPSWHTQGWKTGVIKVTQTHTWFKKWILPLFSNKSHGFVYTTDWSTKYFQVIRQKLFDTLRGKWFQSLLGYKLLNPQIPNLSTQQFLLGGKTWPLLFHVLLTKEIAVVRFKMTISPSFHDDFRFLDWNINSLAELQLFHFYRFLPASVRKPQSVQLQRTANHIIDNSLVYSLWESVS